MKKIKDMTPEEIMKLYDKPYPSLVIYKGPIMNTQQIAEEIAKILEAKET